PPPRIGGGRVVGAIAGPRRQARCKQPRRQTFPPRASVHDPLRRVPDCVLVRELRVHREIGPPERSRQECAAPLHASLLRCLGYRPTLAIRTSRSERAAQILLATVRTLPDHMVALFQEVPRVRYPWGGRSTRRVLHTPNLHRKSSEIEPCIGCPARPE